MGLKIGDVLSNYTIEDMLGQGGMGQVFRVRDRRDGRQMALKIMSETASPERFKIESAALEKLKHPGIPEVYEIGNQPFFYYVQEMLEGISLEQRLTADPFPRDEAVRLFLTLLDVLTVVHEGGFVHRDLTPNNCLIRGDHMCVIDFGVAREGTGQGLTTSGELLGTPQYMSPEQIDQNFGTISPATDIFSLGNILYRMLTGRLPTEPGSYPKVMRQVVRNPPIPPEGVPESLAQVVLKALEKRPEDRFQSCREFAAALIQATQA